MKHIQEPARTIPIMAETDVLVVGSGPGGLSSAIASAREGINTILLDRYGCFGGVLSQVGVEGIAWYRHEQTLESNGIGNEFEVRAKELGGSSREPQSDSEALDAEMFKVVADKMVLESGVRPLLHAMAVDVIMEDNIIKGVIIESKSGRQAILAKRVIDATGDADIAARAGAPYTKASKEELMMVTVMFACRGINRDVFQAYVKEELKPSYADWAGESWSQQASDKEKNLFSPYLENPFNRAVKEGLISLDENISIGGTWSTLSPEGDATQLNMVHMLKQDCTDVWDLTASEIKGRDTVLKAITALNKYVPGFEKARLRNFGMTLGTRESRKIIGRSSLTEHDVMNQGEFDDTIGIFPEFIDGRGILILPTTGRYFQVPLGCMIPQKVENLLVVGRAVSGDKTAHCAFRNMMCCTVTGQGAGTAAAVSLKSGVSVSKVKIDDVQKLLIKRGVKII
ncbi:MAG: FAD-dependent oxidoreductase [Desulfobacula sp.]|jgi:ribulose 1,5-bisphosphate synthetase/thiazole synthase|uniref:FAD-dependent oxidoreductase n=1 Tax=Desulfobacula sp. TaxID=2593537 RepID=UPI001D45C254|nr:FAD-dependent oxidoreductase [Desulfobacula sp.]MBT5547029.1 FAD-dependent oxidoreductase [Desulfobacula sp.]MBT7051963.1 FAD-dependent oxidoreductase [Desulfobacula sp.]MBT7259542.1 FAD-dependent oxidoreductase [Desulfobacula sp.]